ncbi:MAG: class I SAM-dependent methyltransferase [Chloroflexi bacterium]|nr:class I SAM-dependent methyltransferase [Chloroflexota bacterium]
MPSKSRLFAAVYDRVTASAERSVFPAWRAYVAGEAKGRVLEIGAGTGANLPYYPKGVRLTVIEPNPHMMKRLKAKSTRLGLQVTYVTEAVAERLPFLNASFDTVVSTLVLCSVDDPIHSLREVRRVLAARGELRFMEHVRDSGRWRHFQDISTPLWRRVGAVCHPNRDTVAAIRAAGLEVAEVRAIRFGPYPVRPHVVGMARKAV